jgi:ADP-ribose pyrophosphatase YjhB (NUDIX family)
MSIMRRQIGPLLNPAFRAWWRLSRSMTLGVRGVAEDANGQILLVRHTYKEGWYLPGGGVERGQTAEQALVMEMQQEAGVGVVGAPELFGVYLNEPGFRGDHVFLFRALTWRAVRADNRGEISELGFFPRMALPAGTTPATRARLAEIYDGAPRSPYWPVTSA